MMYRTDGEVWLSQVRIWQCPDFRFDWIELTYMNGKSSVLPSLPNLLYMTSSSLSSYSVHVSMVSTYWRL